VDDRAHIPCPQALFEQVLRQHDKIVFLDHHSIPSKGYVVMSRGAMSAHDETAECGSVGRRAREYLWVQFDDI
jgi:hypothetical protein